MVFSPHFVHGQAPLSAELATHGGLKPAHGGVGGAVRTYGPEVWVDGAVVAAADSVIVSPQRYRVVSLTGANSGAVQGPTGLTPGDVYLVAFTLLGITALGGGVRIGNTGPAMIDVGRQSLLYTIEAGGTIFIKRFAGVTDILIGDVTAKKVTG